MSDGIFIKDGIIIPESEIEITASRSGGPGGQNVNKTSTRITVRWNIKNSTALSIEEKERVMQKLSSKISGEGDLIINNSASRSQDQNKKNALENLAAEIAKALIIPKKRTKTRISKSSKEARLHTKSIRSNVKKLRKVKIDF
jgi:ribosome-associated protein